MIVTYAPEDGEATRYVFDPSKVRASAAMEVEQRYGDSWRAFLSAVDDGSVRARRVLLWHVMRRDHPKLRFDDTPDFAADEMTVELSAADLRKVRARVETLPDISEETRDEALVKLDEQILAAQESEDGHGGKALSPKPA